MNKKKVINILSNIFIGACLIACIVFFISKTCFVSVVVNGSSMNPTIENGSKGFMVKVNEKTKIERFDVVASKYGKAKDSFIIKRVLGLPNEKVRLINNTLYVNNEVVEQDFSFIPRSDNFPLTYWTLGENEYLLVGDNRAATISPVVESKENILGKNGFAYLTYDVHSSKCINSEDYSGCAIDNRKWYLFKNGK